jgi:hypothetical protein
MGTLLSQQNMDAMLTEPSPSILSQGLLDHGYRFRMWYVAVADQAQDRITEELS